MITKRIQLSALFICFLLTWTPGESQAGQSAPLPPPPRAEAAGLEEIPAWQARLELARLLSYDKRYQEALAEYEKVLKAKPEMTAARLEKAKVLAWMGESDKALASFQGLSKEGLDDESRLALADIHLARKEYDKAEPLYAQFLANHPDDHAVRLRLADLLTWDKQYERAIGELEKILALRPNDVQVRRRYGRVLGWAGRREEAITNLRQTLGE